MKKIVTIVSVTILIWGCAKKMTPASSVTPSSNSSMANNNNPVSSGKTNTAVSVTTATTATTTTTAPTAARESNARTLTPVEESMIAGQNTFNAKCGRCHGLKVPSEYTDLRWVEVMQVMAPKANLSAIEKENVLAFVRANAKKG